MRDIEIKIDENGYAECVERFIANQYENEATQLIFDLPASYTGAGYFQYVVFTLSDGQNIIRQMIDSKCVIDNDITNISGLALLQVFIKNIEGVDDLSNGLVMCSQPISCFIKPASYNPKNVISNSIDKNIILYLDEFDALLAEIRLVDNRLANIIDGNSDMAEIIDARGAYTVLRKRLDAMTSNTSINAINLQSLKNTITEDFKKYYKKSETYTKEEVNELVSIIPNFNIVVADKLPSSIVTAEVIYLIPSEDDPEYYNEYIFYNDDWRPIGKHKLALDNYYNKDEIDESLATRDSDLKIINDISNPLLYVSNNSKIEIDTKTYSSTGDVVVKLYNGLVYRSESGDISFSLEDIVEMLGTSATLSEDETNVTIIIPSFYALAIDTVNSKLLIVYYTTALTKRYHIALFSNYANTRGILYDIYVRDIALASITPIENKSNFYIGSDYPIDIVKDESTGAIKLITTKGFTIKYSENIGASIETLSTQLGTKYATLSEDGKTLTITIPSYYALYFDFYTKKWKIGLIENIGNKNNIKIVLYNGWCNPTGEIVSIYNRHQINKIKSNSITPIEKNSAFYISNDGTIEIEKDMSTGAINLILNNGLTIRGSESIGVSIETLSTQLGENTATLSEDGKTLTITINSYCSLYFDFSSKTWKIGYIDNIVSKTNIKIVLVNGWANPTGELMDIYNRLNIDNVLAVKDDDIYNRYLFNSSQYIELDWVSKCAEFSKLINGTGKIESFLFFTDPHTMGFGGEDGYHASLQKYIGTIEKIYNSTPTDFIVCGGDWLNNSDTQDEACFKLGYIDGFMRSKFKNYYSVMGNHDDNYQGKLDADSEARTGTLDTNTLINLWYREYGKTYYSFDGVNSKNYVLDTGIDWDTSMFDYRWEQIDWLANSLKNDNPEHSSIMLHIVFGEENAIQTMAENVGLIIEAFNNHTSVTLNNITYDFTNNTGHIDFVLCGHNHKDYDSTLGGVPCISTTNLKQNGVATFDLVLADYDNNKLHLIRVGTGDNREFSI